MKKQANVAPAETNASPGRELHLKTAAEIWPPKADGPWGDASPTLKERKAEELRRARLNPQGKPARPQTNKRVKAASPKGRFVNEPGHILESVGNVGKPSPITRAKPSNPFPSPVEMKTLTSTLHKRFLSAGMGAYGNVEPKSADTRRK